MRAFAPGLLLLLATVLQGKVIVFWRDGFPTIESQAVSQQSLSKALSARDQTVIFNNLQNASVLANPQPSDLLVMPYGSGLPISAWPAIHEFLRNGASLLVLGGRPFRIPVSDANGSLSAQAAEDGYLRDLGIVHTYEAPQTGNLVFGWRDGYGFMPSVRLNAQKYFVLEGRLDGLAYMRNADGEKVASPAVVVNHSGVESGDMLGSRWVFLDFQPQPGFWDSADGIALLRTAADYARAGATLFSIETPSAVLRPGEAASAIVHFRNVLDQRLGHSSGGEVRLQLRSGQHVIASKIVNCTGDTTDTNIQFPATLAPGLYTLSGTYFKDDAALEFTENAFWVEDKRAVQSGPKLGVSGDFLTRNGQPFFPFGTNYFTTEENGWDFSGPRNAAVWERDFAEMEKHGVSFVRTGVWGGQLKFLSGPEGGVPERFLRNVEGYLLCAQHHHIAVDFTFFAFDPQTTFRIGETAPAASLPGANPYLDPVTIRAEQNYVLSIVDRFKNVPYLCWDLINEPSFSSPSHLWHGNTPNGDPAELRAWHEWLRDNYKTTAALASAWNVAADQFNGFDSVPLPTEADLTFNLEHGQVGQVRAIDYNLFAQDMFGRWVKTMVSAIRLAGSEQLIDVGQDEGGVENRVLNQFYANAGLSFTTNHTYRQNSALLWDSLAAKVPGIPNMVGETGYQPIIYPNGDWHFDELTGAGLIERKWANGFAGATSGALSWDWAREIYFGIKRSDGSDKIWEDMMRDMGRFAEKAASAATGVIQPEVAIVLPQSLQLSVFNPLAIAAQQNCVRALYGYARSEAYMIGEDQLDHLGNPKLILLSSPWILNQSAWETLIQKVNDGAVLLVTGRFDQDPHFRPTDRAAVLNIGYQPAQLFTRDNDIAWPSGAAHLTYEGTLTDFLPRATFAGNQTFIEKPFGRGKLLLCAFPLELNKNVEAVAEVYQYALTQAGVKAVYTSTVKNSGVLICPTQFPHATLYVLTSETGESAISFTDERSGKQFSGSLQPGRAALLLVGEKGDLLASYNWQ